MKSGIKRPNPFNLLPLAYGVGRQIGKRFRGPGPGTRTRTTTRRRNRSLGSFNSGYSLITKKAVNTKRRRRRASKKMRIRKRRYVNNKRSHIIAKIGLENISVNITAMNEMERSRGALLIPNCEGGSTFGLNTLHCGGPTATDTILTPSTGVVPHFLPCHVYPLNWSPVNGRTVVTPGNLIAWKRGSDVVDYGLAPIMEAGTNDGETVNNTYSQIDAPQTSLWSESRITSDAQGFRVYGNRKVYLKDIKIQLNMYGQTNQDTLYRVDIVRFDPRFASDVANCMLFSQDLPSFVPPGTRGFVHNGNEISGNEPLIQSYRIAGGPCTTAGEWNQFWHQMVVRYTQNPAYQGRISKGPLKIVKSYKFKIPEQSADFDRVPCVRTKIRVPVGRVLNRYWKHGSSSTHPDPENAFDLNNPIPDEQSNVEASSGFVDPRYMMFMIIRATNTDKRSIDSGFFESSSLGVNNVTPGVDPTYDINMQCRMCIDM